jgi:hypothetical protein
MRILTMANLDLEHRYTLRDSVTKEVGPVLRDTSEFFQ